MIEAIHALCSLPTFMKLVDVLLTYCIVVIERGITYKKRLEERLRVLVEVFYK